MRARLAGDTALTSPEGKRQFLRGDLTPPSAERDDAGTVRAVGGSGSHLIAALAHANALIDIPEGTGRVAPGDEVTVVPLD